MRWVEDSEVMEESPTTEASETCNFCGKVFDTHHGFTAHLRTHGDDLNNHIFNIISSATKPMSIDDIQALSGISVNVRNSIYRLVGQNRIRRVKRGKFAVTKSYAAPKPAPIVKSEVSMKNSIPEADWDSLLVAQLKKHPEIYQRISNEVLAGIKQYLARKA